MKNIVGKNIQKIREKQGVTQEQLAIKLEVEGWKVDRFLISKIERGERQVLDTEVVLLSKVLKVAISKLFEENT